MQSSCKLGILFLKVIIASYIIQFWVVLHYVRYRSRFVQFEKSQVQRKKSFNQDWNEISYRLAILLFRVSTLFGRSYILLTFLDFFLERDSFKSFMPGFTQFSKKLSLSAIFFDLIFSYSLSDTFKISSVATLDSFTFSPILSTSSSSN